LYALLRSKQTNLLAFVLLNIETKTITTLYEIPDTQSIAPVSAALQEVRFRIYMMTETQLFTISYNTKEIVSKLDLKYAKHIEFMDFDLF